MKAVFYRQHGSAEVLEVGELAIPEPGPEQVLVRVAAAGVNPIDRRLRSGELQEYISRTFPVVPGWDFAGEIVALGTDVNSGWQAGDLVMGLAFTWSIQHGTYAEYVPVDAASIAKVPEGFDLFQAAALPLVSLTAWQSIHEYGGLAQGQSALIQAGAGGVGSVAIPMAKHLGARVYATCSTASMGYVSERGADVVIDYTQEDYAQVLRDLEPEGLDVILETLLGDGVPETAIGLAKDGGTVIFMNNEPPALPEIEARGIRTQFLHHRPDGAMLAELADLYGQGILPAPPVEVLPLAAAVEAHQRSEHGHTRGKIVLAIGD